MALSTLLGVVWYFLAIDGYSILVMELSISTSSTDIMIASLRYWYPLICAGTPISWIMSVTSFSRLYSFAILFSSPTWFWSYCLPEGTVIIIWNSLSLEIKSLIMRNILSLSCRVTTLSCSILFLSNFQQFLCKALFILPPLPIPCLNTPQFGKFHYKDAHLHVQLLLIAGNTAFMQLLRISSIKDNKTAE